MSEAMLDGGAVDAVAKLAHHASNITDKYAEVEVDGHKGFVSQYELKFLQPPGEPEPTPLVFHTLTAIAEYLKENRDELPLEKLLVHVSSPTKVWVLGPLTGYHNQRFEYAVAQFSPPAANFKFDYPYSVENMIIGLQSLFGDTDDKASLLQLLGNVTAEEAVQNTDDGMSQQVSVRAGVVRASTVEVQNPFTLAPYRTFPDVPQPASPFVVRFHGGGDGRSQAPEARLLEADGGAWELTAVQGIVKKLEGLLKGTPVHVIG